MASLNQVFLIGNLVRDPELRYAPSGDAVANLSVAVNRWYTTREGEKKEETCFVTVVVWRKQAELCGEYLGKGSPVLIEGRLQHRKWETSEGEKRSALEVVARRIQFLARKGKEVTADEGAGAQVKAQQEEEPVTEEANNEEI